MKKINFFLFRNGEKMNYLIIDERMRKIEKETLINLDYELIEIRKSKKVYSEISSHVDIFICKIGNKLISEKSQYENIKLTSKILIEEGNDEIKENYPEDIKYNICIVGNKAIHNFNYTDLKIKENLIKNKYELIDVKQGYTNCSIAVIDENSIIISDKGLYKELKNKDLNILFLDYEPDIKLLNEKGYSNKKGFIGGAISRVKNNIIVSGDLKKIDKDSKIRNFIKERNLNLIEFNGLDVIDYGGILEC